MCCVTAAFATANATAAAAVACCRHTQGHKQHRQEQHTTRLTNNTLAKQMLYRAAATTTSKQFVKEITHHLQLCCGICHIIIISTQESFFICWGCLVTIKTTSALCQEHYSTTTKTAPATASWLDQKPCVRSSALNQPQRSSFSCANRDALNLLAASSSSEHLAASLGGGGCLDRCWLDHASSSCTGRGLQLD